MATSAAPISGFEQWLPIFELAANTTLTALSVAGVVPGGVIIPQLAVALESGIGPLIEAIKNKMVGAPTVLAALGSIVGVLNALKQVQGLPPALIAKIDEYLLAAQNAISAYMVAQKGFDATLYAPVQAVA